MQTHDNLKNTKLFLGALASKDSGGSHYVDMLELQQYIEGAQEKYSPAFGGVMLWDAYGAKGMTTSCYSASATISCLLCTQPTTTSISRLRKC